MHNIIIYYACIIFSQLTTLLNIDNPYFEGMVNQIYPPELQFNKANTLDTEAPFLDLHLSISNGFVYDERDDLDFDMRLKPLKTQLIKSCFSHS